MIHKSPVQSLAASLKYQPGVGSRDKPKPLHTAAAPRKSSPTAADTAAEGIDHTSLAGCSLEGSSGSLRSLGTTVYYSTAECPVRLAHRLQIWVFEQPLL